MSYYPDAPGFQKGSDTSLEAAVRTKDSSENQRLIILDLMIERERAKAPAITGITIDEAAVHLSAVLKRDIPPGSASARMRELELNGMVRKSEFRRKTRTGSPAKIYQLVPDRVKAAMPITWAAGGRLNPHRPAQAAGEQARVPDSTDDMQMALARGEEKPPTTALLIGVDLAGKKSDETAFCEMRDGKPMRTGITCRACHGQGCEQCRNGVIWNDARPLAHIAHRGRAIAQGLAAAAAITLGAPDAKDKLADAMQAPAPPPRSTIERIASSESLNGHGHVFPRLDGTKKKCGGIATCKKCIDLKRYKEALEQGNEKA